MSAVLEDLRASVASGYRGRGYWARVLAKAVISPNIHVVLLYRLSAACFAVLPLRPLAFVLRSVASVWGGTEIHPAARIGPGLYLVHSQKVVIGPRVTIGANARIGHGVTIAGDTGGRAISAREGFPVLGDGVTVALDSVILGPVRVGDGAFIMAQSLVTKDVAAMTIVRGSPASFVRHISDETSPTADVPLQKGHAGDDD